MRRRVPEGRWRRQRSEQDGLAQPLSGPGTDAQLRRLSGLRHHSRPAWVGVNADNGRKLLLSHADQPAIVGGSPFAAWLGFATLLVGEVWRDNEFED